MLDLSDAQLTRYARNILLPQIDIIGQQKLLKSRVTVIGAGGLGSPVLQYLAAAGVGCLVVIDDDVVEETNLQRQVVHKASGIGQAKTASAAQFIHDLNPEVQVIVHNDKLDADNVDALLKNSNVVVAGTDNFVSRYVASDFCMHEKIPLVSGAAIGFSGQVTSFNYSELDSPCFRCLYPNGQDDEISCASAGVLGPTVGTIGSLMAMEAIKILTGAGQPLFGQLMVWDALNMDWQKFNYTKVSSCRCSL